MKLQTKEQETYSSEVKEKWGSSDAYTEYTQRTREYSPQKWDTLSAEMDRMMAAFALCMKKKDAPDSVEAQSLVKALQDHITGNYYPCTKEILACLGQMYVTDQRFTHSIDQHAAGTAAFVCEAIAVYCKV